MIDPRGIVWAEGGPLVAEKAIHDEWMDFDFEALDSLEDRIREGIASGRDVSALVRELTAIEINEAVTEAIAAVVCYIADSMTPRFTADQAAWVVGMRARQGISLPQIAKTYGVSKQAFCQAAIKLAKVLKLKPARSMRSELAKAVMQIRHYKRKRNGRNSNPN